MGEKTAEIIEMKKITKAVSVQMSGVKSATEDTVSIVQKFFLIFPKFLNIKLREK